MLRVKDQASKSSGAKPVAAERWADSASATLRRYLTRLSCGIRITTSSLSRSTRSRENLLQLALVDEFHRSPGGVVIRPPSIDAGRPKSESIGSPRASSKIVLVPSRVSTGGTAPGLTLIPTSEPQATVMAAGS